MAKGQVEKKIVYDKIMEVFDGAFSPDGKVIRVPISGEDGIVEIKVALTAAKDVLGGDGNFEVSQGSSEVASNEVPAPPTEEEKNNIKDLMARLGIS